MGRNRRYNFIKGVVMRSLLFGLIFLAMAQIAIAEAPKVEVPSSQTVTAPTVPMILVAPSCHTLKSVLSDLSSIDTIDAAKFAGAYATMMVALNLFANLMGWLAGMGSTSASSAVVVLRFVIALLGWAGGKFGFATPKNDMVKTMPKLSDMKAMAGVKEKEVS